MTFGKAVAAVLVLVAVFALGVWTGPYLTDRDVMVADKRAHETARVSDDDKAEKARASRPRAVRPEHDAEVAGLPASDPEVMKRLKPVLNMGTNMNKAAEGFKSA
jgi:hypothetical protein